MFSSNRGEETRDVFIFNDTLDEKSGGEIFKWLLSVSAEELDEATLYINSPGGLLDQAVAIIDLMNAIPTKIITVGVGHVGSAALMIFMAGDYRISYPNTIFLSHQYSCGVSGKEHELEASATVHKMYSNVVRNEIYKKHLGISDADMNKLLGPSDFYMTAKTAKKYNILDQIVETNKLVGVVGREYNRKLAKMQEKFSRAAIKELGKDQQL